MPDWEDWIGKTETANDMLSPSLLARHSATFNAPQSEVPLSIHWCLCTPTTHTKALAPDGHPLKGGFLPPIPLPRRMWASSEIEFFSAMMPSDKITRRSQILSVSEKTGTSGALAFVKVEHIWSTDKENRLREVQTLVYLEPTTERKVLPGMVDFELPANCGSRVIKPTETLLFRYSALTFNSHRIHYDQAYAREQEGYPALVVHGPLTASLMLKFASETIGSHSISGFSFRGVSPAYVDQDLTFTLEKDGQSRSWTALGADGRTVMSGHLLLRSQ